ncbi:hypothetical protein RRG08_017445 [Elysia crispata]|uniref:Uncharacterized protein n=1 Tax=Elysia crispata TaxID=231223 RepID=A0AAE1B6W7_9GAST|nr:hypothetical protein RRG08_017445 [Elysia crispata]
MTTIETITRHHALGPDASPGRGSVVPQNQGPRDPNAQGFRTLTLRALRDVGSRDLRNLFPGVPYRQTFQEAIPESRTRDHISPYADAARSPPPPLNIYMPAPETLPSTASPQHHEIKSRSSTVLRPVAAGHAQEGTGAGQQELNMPAPITLPSSASLSTPEPIESRPSPNIINSGRPSTGGNRGGSSRLEAAGGH